MHWISLILSITESVSKRCDWFILFVFLLLCVCAVCCCAFVLLDCMHNHHSLFLFAELPFYWACVRACVRVERKRQKSTRLNLSLSFSLSCLLYWSMRWVLKESGEMPCWTNAKGWDDWVLGARRGRKIEWRHTIDVPISIDCIHHLNLKDRKDWIRF